MRLLQAAHAGELAAARAYRGHWKSLRDHAERAEVQRIEDAEMVHRAHVRVLLDELGAEPRRWREAALGAVGLFFGFLCHVSGWFMPMYMAGRLEAMNVGQYEAAVALAREAGLHEAAVLLAGMVEEEMRHEAWFSDRVRGHWMLPVVALVFGWRPAPLPA